MSKYIRKFVTKTFGKKNTINILKHIAGSRISEAPLDDIRSNGERFVEYPWILRNLNLEKGKILDVGCYGSFFSLLLASQGFEVWGIDLKEYEWSSPNFKFIKGDIRSANLPVKFFDRLIMVSTLEHIGVSPEEPRILDNSGDVQAIKNMAKSLKDDGSILLTVPYGKASVVKGQRIYDAKKFNEMFKSLKIVKKDFFIDRNGIWLPSTEGEVGKIVYKNVNAVCKGIACLKLCKR